jgi:hypothetical protein
MKFDMNVTGIQRAKCPDRSNIVSGNGIRPLNSSLGIVHKKIRQASGPK